MTEHAMSFTGDYLKSGAVETSTSASKMTLAPRALYAGVISQ